MSAVTGAVVAGGAGRRMGRDKRSIVVDGLPMLRRAVTAVASVTDEVVVACRHGSPPDPALLGGLDVRLVFDRLPDAGPLAGLEAALAAARRDLVLVVAGDMPWLEPAVLRLLIAEATARPDAQIVALATERGPEPLLAVYRRTALATVSRLLDAGERRAGAVLEAVPTVTLAPDRWVALDPTGRSMRNVNAPADLEPRTMDSSVGGIDSGGRRWPSQALPDATPR